MVERVRKIDKCSNHRVAFFTSFGISRNRLRKSSLVKTGGRTELIGRDSAKLGCYVCGRYAGEMIARLFCKPRQFLCARPRTFLSLLKRQIVAYEQKDVCLRRDG